VPFFSYIFVAIAAYLLGSIPTGYLVARAKGIDIRKVGSGNIGATNAFRVLGKPAGIFVLLVDALKGFAAAAWISPLIYNWIEPHYFGLAPGFHAASPELQMRYKVIAGICAVLGHNYTCWLKFKGGKGIATTAGVYFALAPLAAGIALATWIVLTILTRYVSVGSIAAAIALVASVWIFEKNLLLGIVTTALSALAILKHKKNIQRLIAGTENRIGKKTSEGAK
jgi:glycerol-3-phosphate acyltransferase PlsY